MKAFLLSAGLGTRLRPLTNTVPKCLVPINRKPLLEYWFILFQKYGIDEVLINLHYLPEKIMEFVNSHSYPIKIETVYEEELFGSAGTVAKNWSWVKNDENFLIIYADNLSTVNLHKILSSHRISNPVLTMGLFRTNRPEQCGIATLNEECTIIEFQEKSKNPKTNLANAGIYVAGRKLYEYLPQKTPADFGYDVFPKLVGKMKGFIIEDYILDIGDMENYRKAQSDAKNLIF
ncbi:D-glycero-alpha-D-manno-heptose 1-phosphate guanylyltransferase [bacterium BMS3Bbin03]|nr:D-glycero-alpha-D-manno-heptose 1-phosphate guanylyltransferase [bacterium BMS3Bbin03]